jgi:hypothetical protein
MKPFYHSPVYIQLRRTLFSVFFIVLAVCLVLPGIIGWQIRLQLRPVLEQLQKLGFEYRVTESSWLQTDYEVITPNLLDAPVVLSIRHGPILWHLADTPVAIAEAQISTTTPNQPPFVSGSTLLTLGTQWQVQGVMGLSTPDDSFLAEWQLHWPLWSVNDRPAPLPVIGMALPGATSGNIDVQLLPPSQPGFIQDAVGLAVYRGWLLPTGATLRSALSIEQGVLYVNGQAVNTPTADEPATAGPVAVTANEG